MIKELRITLKNLGKIRPGSIDDYLAVGGYDSLRKALQIDHVSVIDEMLNSSLRGRGGAGFSTGLKKKFTSESCLRCKQKYLICNADEGEPGTWKDRIIMENDPHLLLEGMLIAAYAIGASKAYIYIRAEYYRSIELLQKAILHIKERGISGQKIFGSNFSCEIMLKPGAGSYLCGEELTLLESLEGKRGYPRIKPPFPAEKGLWNAPTLVNNVETLATLPTILDMGAAEYSKLGIPESPGTKVFTISGDVENPGFFEVEMGATLRELIYDLAGGIKNGAELEAVLMGGAAGTFVDSSVLDTPIGYDSLKEKGAVLGSGAIMVMAKGRSVTAMLESILSFFKHESCGKCVPCRVGTDRLYKMISDINNENKEGFTLDDMIDEAQYMAATSLCPLGQSPIMPLASLNRYFRHLF